MTTLPADRYLQLLATDGGRLGAAASRDLAARVPGCPEWDASALVAHTSVIHRWVAEVVGTRSRERVSRRHIVAPEGGQEILEWYGAGLEALRRALAEAGPDAAVWNWTGASATAAFWFRRMAQETAVHRWDAESATGTPAPLDADLAGDGIAEMLDVFLPLTSAAGEAPDLGGSLHVHTTDVEGEWTLRPGPDRLEVERGHGKGDAALRGPASDVLLALWGRPVLDGVEIFGDASVVERWRQLFRF